MYDNDLVESKEIKSVLKKMPSQFPATEKNIRDFDEYEYPIFWLNNTIGWVYSHRLMYALEIGEIPEGKDVISTCGSKQCLDPKHIVLIDSLEL